MISYLSHPFKEYKKELLITVVLFILGILLGLSELIDLSFITQTIKEKFDAFKDFQGIELFFAIFLNNLQASAIAYYLGLLFAIVPLFIIFANGLIIGLILPLSEQPLFQTILKLIPHGVFELPAIFLAVALGIRLGTWTVHKNKITYIKEQLTKGTTILLTVIMPLLFVAAIIETIAIELLR